jgi:hypothetical protein
MVAEKKEQRREGHERRVSSKQTLFSSQNISGYKHFRQKSTRIRQVLHSKFLKVFI